MATMSLACLLLISLISQSCCDLQWTYNIFSDPSGHYRLSWTHGNGSVTFEVQAATKGLVGLGFSKRGQLSGSDAIIGWVNGNGKSTIQDCHFDANGKLVIDDSQDYQLLDGYQNDDHTTMRFRRNFDTCNIDDYIITPDTVYVLYTWFPQEPNSSKIDIPQGIQWSSQPSLLFSETPESIHITEDVLHWDVLLPNITIPNNITTYHCMMVDLPKLQGKYQLIGYDILISPEKIYRGTLFPCYEDGKLPAQLLCKPPVAVWAIGGKRKSFPPDVGIPIGSNYGSTNKFLMSVHFNNQLRKEGIKDSSGIRLYLTKAHRPKEAAFLHISSKLRGTSMVLPPHQPNFTATVHCPAECTQQGLPIDGIHVMGVGFHAHSTARRVRIRHVRGDIELPYIATDNNFQYHFQEMRYLKDHVRILPGDHLIAECEYDLTSKNSVTLGGKNTEDEMCLHYLFYYPRSKLNFVYSGPRAAENYEFFNIRHPYLQLLEGHKLNDMIKSFNWDNVSLDERNTLQKIQSDDMFSGYCLGFDGKGTLFKHFTSQAPRMQIPYVPLMQLFCNTTREN